MNKSQFVEKLAKKVRLPKSQTELVLDAAIKLIQHSVSKGDEVKLVGFGTFDQLVRKKRKGRNPKTGTAIEIPQTRVPRFRPGKEFKTSLDKKS